MQLAIHEQFALLCSLDRHAFSQRLTHINEKRKKGRKFALFLAVALLLDGVVPERER